MFSTERQLFADLQQKPIRKKEKENLWIHCGKVKVRTGYKEQEGHGGRTTAYLCLTKATSIWRSSKMSSVGKAQAVLKRQALSEAKWDAAAVKWRPGPFSVTNTFPIRIIC